MSTDPATLEEAQARLLAQVEPTAKTEWIPILEAVDRVSFKAVYARMPQPPFHRSPLDGYALNHKDTLGASERTPVTLQVKNTVYAGDFPSEPLKPMEACRIMTGAMIPEGADCIIRQEDTDGGSGTVTIAKALNAHENFCFIGEDVQLGSLLVDKGEKLHFASLAVLAGQGFSCVQVHAKPRIAILSTGDELVRPGEPLLPGKIYNNNNILLGLRLRDLGAEPHIEESCSDQFELLLATVEKLLAQYDMVITTGGVSVGQKDYMPAVAKALQGDFLFQGIAMKPGAPALGVAKDGKVLLCLSGNPYAAFCTFELLAHPAVKKMAGHEDYAPTRKKAVTQSYFHKASPVRRVIRANLEGNYVYIPEEGHASGMLSSLSDCNCMVDIPPGTTALKPNQIVDVILL